MNVIVFAVFVCASLRLVNGYCYGAPPMVENLVHGTRNYCLYKGLEILPGSEIVWKGCERCTCSEAGLSCCGFGINGGIAGLPPHCKMLVDGCRGIPVLRVDESRRCGDGMPIQNPIQGVLQQLKGNVATEIQHAETNAATENQHHPPGFNP